MNKMGFKQSDGNVDLIDPDFDYVGVKKKFEEAIRDCMLSVDRREHFFLSEKEIADIKDILIKQQDPKNMFSLKTNDKIDINWCLQKFEIINVRNEVVLITKRKPLMRTRERFIVPYTEYFDIISSIHRRNAHAGALPLFAKIVANYNMPFLCIKIFMNICNVCNKNAEEIKQFNHKSYVDIIRMNNPSNEFTVILVYIDLITHFLLLKPMLSDTIEHIGIEILQIFTDFGVPIMIMSKDVIKMKQVVVYMKHVHPDFDVIVNSTDKTHVNIGQIKGNVEHWMKTNGTDKWAMGCGYVQWLHNTTEVDAKSPYKAVFKVDPCPPTNVDMFDEDDIITTAGGSNDMSVYISDSDSTCDSDIMELLNAECPVCHTQFAESNEKYFCSECKERIHVSCQDDHKINLCKLMQRTNVIAEMLDNYEVS